MMDTAGDAGEVVISGLSGRFPESDNVAEFREHLINGDDMTTENDGRWEPGMRKYFVMNDNENNHFHQGSHENIIFLKFELK